GPAPEINTFIYVSNRAGEAFDSLNSSLHHGTGRPTRQLRILGLLWRGRRDGHDRRKHLLRQLIGDPPVSSGGVKSSAYLNQALRPAPPFDHKVQDHVSGRKRVLAGVRWDGQTASLLALEETDERKANKKLSERKLI